MFKQGDYIVINHDDYQHDDQFASDFVFKQRMDGSYLLSELDIKGSNSNGWSMISYQSQNKWRYATAAEIREYDRIGKPYNVTELKPEVNNFYEIF